MWHLTLFVGLFILTGAAAGLTGAGAPKWIRRFALPGFIAALGFIILKNVNALGLVFRAAPQALGYGMPDATDPGSFLGRFWTSQFPTDAKKALIATRGSVGLLDGLVCAYIPYVAGHPGAWALWLFAVAGLIAANVLPPVCLPNAGQIEVGKFKLNWHEILIAGASSCIVVKLMLLVR